MYRSGREATRGIVFLWVALVVAAAALRFAWIPDIPFVNDEPQLLFNALEANEAGRWVHRGLRGSRGLDYGPLPTWMYQAGLHVTTNPMHVAALKTAAITGLTAACVWMLGTLWPHRAAALVWVWFLSPSLALFSRDLWDVSWTVPMSLLAWTAYLKFDARPRLRSLAATLLGLTGLLLTHLMTVPFIAVIAAHLLWTQRRWLWQRRWAVCGVLLVCSLLPASPYLAHLWTTRGATAPLNWSLTSGLQALQFHAPFVASSIGGALGEPWWRYPGFGAATSALLHLLQWWSWVGALCVWAGIGVAGWHVARRFARRTGTPPSPAAAGLSASLGTADLLAVIAWLLHGLLAATQALPPLLQYTHMLAPIGLHFLCRGLWALLIAPVPRPLVWVVRTLLIGWVLSLALTSVALPWRLHAGHGMRDVPYGPTLANQWAIAQQLAHIANGQPIYANAAVPMHFPHSLGSLRALARVHLGVDEVALAPPDPARRVEINYGNPDDVWDGTIVLTIHPVPAAPVAP